MEKFGIGNDGVLRDNHGNVVGKINTDNTVTEAGGWRNKGRITPDGQYQDEYGVERGWTHSDTTDSVSSAVGCFLFTLLFGILHLFFQKATELDKEKKVNLWSSLSAVTIVTNCMVSGSLQSNESLIGVFFSGFGILLGLYGLSRPQAKGGRIAAIIGIIGNGLIGLLLLWLMNRVTSP